MRVTKSAALKGTDDSGNNNVYLGRRDKDFSFADLKPFKIEFVECSARGDKDDGEPDLGHIEAWLEQVA